jgi:hypothetical protein
MMRALVTLLLVLAFGPAVAQNEITYQGQLQQSGTPFDGAVDLRFRLYDAPGGGTEVAPEVLQSAVAVENGLFRVALDFGDVFGGGDRYLEVEVDGQVLTPRQRVSPSPVALRSLNDQDTTYAAGSGLVLSGTSFALDLGVTDARYFTIGGQAISDPATEFIGSTNDSAFEIRTRGSRHLRIEPSAPLSDGEPVTANIIAGSRANFVGNDARGATIAGGGAPNGDDPDFEFSSDPNRILSHYATIGGGIRNYAGDDTQTPDAAAFATIGGGNSNEASAYGATIGGGTSNVANATVSTVGGGDVNDATADFATVGGGVLNTASAQAATVAGGYDNEASGDNSTVPGGRGNEAQGNFSLAAGRRAIAANNGSFVWADSQNSNFSSTADDQFSVRAQGGVRLVVGSTTCTLSSGAGDWVCSTVSDRNAKTDLEAVDVESVLEAVTRVPVYRWRYRGASATATHLGPMAQDFHAAFDDIGSDTKRLNTLHLASAALAAVQALEQRQGRLLERVDRLERENRALRELAVRLDRLERQLEAGRGTEPPAAPVAVSTSPATGQ